MVATAPRVSVVIPTYNRVDRLERSIRSVLDQTYADLELIVVDDASTVDTADVIERFDDERLRYIEHETNKGPSAARNTGIEESRGEIVAFQDSDDVWMPSKLEKQVEVFDEAPAEVGVVYTGMWRVLDGETRYLPYPGVERKDGDISESILRQNFISTQMAAVRRRCFDEVGTFDEALQALVDWELWIRMSERYEFRLVDEPLVEAAVEPDSVSEDREGIVEARERIVMEHYDRFDRHSRANNLYYVGHGSMRLGRAEKGRRYLWKAVGSDPRLLYGLSLVCSLFGPRLYGWMYRLFKRIGTTVPGVNRPSPLGKVVRLWTER